MNKNGTGFVFIATGLNFVTEAAESAKYLRRFNSDPICLITDKIHDGINPFWDDLVILSNPGFNLKDKTNLFMAPYEKCVFLDTDTYVTENINELFLLLDEFDLAAHQLFEGHEYEMEGVPHAFPEFNTGVIAYRNTDDFNGFCKLWVNAYNDYLKDTANDQRSFRKTIYHSRLRHTVISPEYNYRAIATNFAVQRLKIIHGRTFSALKELEGKMNRQTVHRAYIPALDAVVSDYMTPNEIRTLWKNTTVLFLKELGRKIIPLSFRNKLRNNKRIRRFFLKNNYQDWVNDKK